MEGNVAFSPYKFYALEYQQKDTLLCITIHMTRKLSINKYSMFPSITKQQAQLFY